MIYNEIKQLNAVFKPKEIKSTILITQLHKNLVKTWEKK